MRALREINVAAWAMIDEVVPIETIPVDRRHNAKVDYPRLQLLASRRL